MLHDKDISSIIKRNYSLGILAVLLVPYCFYLHNFIVPDIVGGADQNAYYKSAKLLSETGISAADIPKDMFRFYGEMQHRGADGKIYSKYPPGVSISLFY